MTGATLCGASSRYLSKIFLIAYTVAARPARAIDVVSGIFFGQTATQFCALPQTWMPPVDVKRIEPLAGVHRAGRMGVESIAWLMAMAPDEVLVVSLPLALGEIGVGFAVALASARSSHTAGRRPGSSRSSCTR